MRVLPSNTMAHRSAARRSSGFVALLIALPIALIGVALGMQAVHAAQDGGTPPGPVPITSRPSHPLGIPAIKPRTALATRNGPRFTDADVRDYLAAHPLILEAAPGTPTPIVKSIQFVTAAQASAMMQGESIGLPDTSSVCVVIVQGVFISSYGPPTFNNSGASASVTTKTLIFDAQTGNLLIG